MSDAIVVKTPDCPACGHSRRVKVITYTVHDPRTGEWYEYDAWACDGCWIVVREIPGSARRREAGDPR